MQTVLQKLRGRSATRDECGQGRERTPQALGETRRAQRPRRPSRALGAPALPTAVAAATTAPAAPRAASAAPRRRGNSYDRPSRRVERQSSQLVEWKSSSGDRAPRGRAHEIGYGRIRCSNCRMNRIESLIRSKVLMLVMDASQIKQVLTHACAQPRIDFDSVQHRAVSRASPAAQCRPSLLDGEPCRHLNVRLAQITARCTRHIRLVFLTRRSKLRLAAMLEDGYFS
eukprot:4230434-Pleurochrysis_carterae.AAC.1